MPEESKFLARPLIYIEWVDITCHDEIWVAPDDSCVSVLSVCSLVGHLLAEDDETICVATSVCDEGHGIRPVVYPKCVIKRIERLTVAELLEKTPRK